MRFAQQLMLDAQRGLMGLATGDPWYTGLVVRSHFESSEHIAQALVAATWPPGTRFISVSYHGDGDDEDEDEDDDALVAALASVPLAQHVSLKFSSTPGYRLALAVAARVKSVDVYITDVELYAWLEHQPDALSAKCTGLAVNLLDTPPRWFDALDHWTGPLRHLRLRLWVQHAKTELTVQAAQRLTWVHTSGFPVAGVPVTCLHTNACDQSRFGFPAARADIALYFRPAFYTLLNPGPVLDLGRAPLASLVLHPQYGRLARRAFASERHWRHWLAVLALLPYAMARALLRAWAQHYAAPESSDMLMMGAMLGRD